MKMRKLDLKRSEVSNKKNTREEDEYDVPMKDKKSEGKEKCVKVVLCK